MRSSRQLRSRLRLGRRLANLDRKPVAVALDNGLHIGFLARLAGEDKGGGKRHIDMGDGGVGALDRACPDPGDDRKRSE